jgi:hypothetical protein
VVVRVYVYVYVNTAYTRERIVITKQQKATAQWVLDQVSEVNPYNRQGENSTQQYNIYQSGFIAAYLASLMLEDPWMRKRFEQHIKSKKES